MMNRFGIFVAAVAASVTLVAGATSALAQAPEKPAEKPAAKKAGAAAKPGATKAAGKKRAKSAAQGKIKDLNLAAKTFTASRKKKGDTVVAWDDKTVFKKRSETPGGKPTDAKAADMKDGLYANVLGKVEKDKVVATQITFGERVKKNKAKLP